MQNPRRILNSYSWSILIVFIVATFAMQYHTTTLSFQEGLQTFPLIVLAIYWSEKSATLLRQPEQHLKKAAVFERDTFMISFSFLLGGLLSLILAYNNSDVRAWWPFIICCIVLYGTCFAVIFASIARAIKNHKTYTMIFALFIVIWVALGQFLRRYVPIPFIGNVDIFFVMTGVLLILHGLFTVSYTVHRSR